MPTLLIEGKKVGLCDITWNRSSGEFDIHNIHPPVLRDLLLKSAEIHIEQQNKPKKRRK
jgi:hypothetical protein